MYMGCSIPINISGGESFPELLARGWWRCRRETESPRFRRLVDSCPYYYYCLVRTYYYYYYYIRRAIIVYNNIHMALLFYHTPGVRDSPRRRRRRDVFRHPKSPIFIAAYLFRKQLFSLAPPRRTEIKPHADNIIYNIPRVAGSNDGVITDTIIII
jgi:hypothetical protein